MMTEATKEITAMNDEEFAAYVQQATVTDLLVAVGDDEALGSRVLAAETARGDDARKSLVDKLTKASEQDKVSEQKKASSSSASKLPSTKPYRVCIVGAVYNEPVIALDADGNEAVRYVTKLGTFREEIQLTDREARRLSDLDAVKDTDAPLSYDEMDDKQLDAAVKDAGIEVTSSGAERDKPLRTDKINALRIYDQGRGVAT